MGQKLGTNCSLPFKHQPGSMKKGITERLASVRNKRLVGRVLTLWRLHQNSGKTLRKLEIGAGTHRIQGFETLDIIGGRHVDYVWDAAKHLPFEDCSFDVIYASHVLEHVAWYQTETVLSEWVRILKLGGRLEIWVPNALKICKALLDYELTGENYISRDGWYRYNPNRDPYKWASGRIYTYGDGTGSPNSHNWHRALFTPQYLKRLLEQVGLRDVREMDQSEVRAANHGWISLGMTGIK